MLVLVTALHVNGMWMLLPLSVPPNNDCKRYILLSTFHVDAAGLNFCTILSFPYLDDDDQHPPKQSRNVKHITSCWSFPKRSELSVYNHHLHLWLVAHLRMYISIINIIMISRACGKREWVRYEARRGIREWRLVEDKCMFAWMDGWMAGSVSSIPAAKTGFIV